MWVYCGARSFYDPVRPPMHNDSVFPAYRYQHGQATASVSVFHTALGTILWGHVLDSVAALFFLN